MSLLIQLLKIVVVKNFYLSRSLPEHQFGLAAVVHKAARFISQFRELMEKVE
ncbi:hypothetical protein [Methylococcus sp. EFPC2]|uniref:hypothetical protein n=1 Tax=Methylococcus sp. EFPC2 TaxID=2812648 RepID=UPI0019689C48|nr:hypothetical protein [Methylococcus sp. EFPC2]QSA96951.1 hypothetical protein JWZ97_17380 [Methylococcus sp. EFPC2]